MTIKFRSPTDTPVHVALTTGHTAIVTREGTELPAAFHAQAIACGAVPVSGSSVSATFRTQMAERQCNIMDALTEMVRSNDKADFGMNGKPDLRRLIDRVGFPVLQEEADAMLPEAKAAAATEAA